MSNEIKNNPRTAILNEYAEPKEFMTKVFLNCDFFAEDWKQNSELIKSQANEIDQMRKRIEELESNQIQLRPIRSRSLHSLDMESTTILNDSDDYKHFSTNSISEKLDDNEKIDKIFISGLPQFSSMSPAWQKE